MGMMRDPYLYPNTKVMKNKLGVIDNEKLNTLEAFRRSSATTLIIVYYRERVKQIGT